MSELRLLLVDDDQDLVRAWRRLFEREGWSCDASTSLASARRRLSAASYDVVLLDLGLPDGQGHELLPAILRQPVRPAVVVLSGSYEAEHALLLLGNCDAFIPKPVPAEVLHKVLIEVAALDRRRQPRSPLAEFAASHDLSDTETTLLRIALEGGGVRESCERLGCKPNSVMTYWKRIFEKTACRSQREVLGALLRYSLADSAHP